MQVTIALHTIVKHTVGRLTPNVWLPEGQVAAGVVYVYDLSMEIEISRHVAEGALGQRGDCQQRIDTQ